MKCSTTNVTFGIEIYFALSGLGTGLIWLTRGDALRACPWLSYFAPLALRSRSDALGTWSIFVAPLAEVRIARALAPGPELMAPLALRSEFARALGTWSRADGTVGAEVQIGTRPWHLVQS